jgi:hypothetical protein
MLDAQLLSSLRSYLAVNTACVNYKNGFFAKSAYFTENNGSLDNSILPNALCFPNNMTLTLISHTQTKFPF